MRNNRKERNAFHSPSYWQSYSDMMAALLLIFILIIAITLAIYKQKQTDLEVTKQQLSSTQADLAMSEEELKNYMAQLDDANTKVSMTQEELQAAYNAIAAKQEEVDATQEELRATKSQLQDIVGVRTDIIRALQESLDGSSMTVDAQNGSITFSSDVLFRYNSAVLTENSKNTLREVIPTYLSVLLQADYRPYIAEIIVEGHTDTEGGYASNMELSFARANAVATFCQNSKNGLTDDQITALQNVLTVNGRSYSSPVYKEGTSEVDMAASRRVEIKFRLKEDEMIEKINEVLNES
ncbi:OmpA family protein [Hominiventricola filiformis]|uniref:OmpA family protein n=1 Tax=Hominiventricola filiformis TaxID=2885352 RepID=A0AAE3D9R9_9FIRM|nr:OmpA family protein [Hominiventricola filiformis]MCC2126063.1 OmpA family protein [Hominiventricola filiformis]QUO21603.1 OmpA family protein [Clostridiaceae bacterium Marseille-Q4143]RHU84467.1 hypothetical protein DXC26_06440 [Clostridiaceae bacterium OM08-6BH]